jgi:hypothetical protein
MFEKRRSRGVLHARMRQVEDELFRAEYSGEINPTRAMPGTFQTITSGPAPPR